MRRAFLDFTRLEATLDLGLTSQEPAGASGAGAAAQQQQQGAAGGEGSGSKRAPQQQQHPAFALEQRGAWHALTLGLTQQVRAVGSVHVCKQISEALKTP